MEGDRWKTVERLYHEAAERPHGEQAAFLESACLGDEDLLRDVESLLADGADGFLEEPASTWQPGIWRRTVPPS